VAAFPVADDDQIMLVTDRGKVIRIPVGGIRIAGRNTQGVTLFDVAEDEHVVAVARLVGAAEANGGGDPNEPEPNGPAPPAASGRNEPDEHEPTSSGSDEPGGGNPNEPEPNSFGSDEPVDGGDPNEPETSHRSELEPLGPAAESPDHG
jgi:DNA gyrase subunit A